MARPLAILLLVVSLAVLHGGWAQDLAVSDVNVGDTGFGVTAGAEGLERFDVEVLGVRAPSGPGFPLLLIRTGGRFLEEAGGVAAGMSGSPIYVERDGVPRLVGALGYGFPGSDHRLALVTPIANMRDLAPEAQVLGVLPPGAVPLTTPLLLLGVDERAATHLRAVPFASDLTLVPLQGGARADLALSPSDLAAGDAVGVALARGDVTIAAVGTLTDVTSTTALLFGHPLLQRGATNFALVPAEVITIVPNLEIPYKLANVGANAVGTVVRDQRAGLAASLGQEPDEIPVRVRVHGELGDIDVTSRVTRDERLLPSLVATVTHAALDAALDAVRGGSAQITWTIDFVDEPSITFLEDRSAARDLATPLAVLAGIPAAILLDNPFQDPNLAALHIDIETFDAPREVELVEVALETPSVRPGEAVQAFVRLQPYRGEAEVRTLSISLPGDVPAGPLRITLRGATVPDPDRDAMIEERERDPLEQVISDLPPIVSWGELLAALRNRPRARELVIEIPGEDRPRRLARIDLGDEEGVIVTGIEHLTVMVETDEPAPTDSETEDR